MGEFKGIQPPVKGSWSLFDKTVHGAPYFDLM